MKRTPAQKAEREAQAVEAMAVIRRFNKLVSLLAGNGVIVKLEVHEISDANHGTMPIVHPTFLVHVGS